MHFFLGNLLKMKQYLFGPEKQHIILASMRLFSFGDLRLAGLESSKLSPQLLLFLTYLRLEQETSKPKLASLFWPQLSLEFSKKGERKDLNNVSVALATLKRETGLGLEALVGLSCDAADLTKAFEDKDYLEVTRLYEIRGFLADIEEYPRLKLGDELYSWLLSKREAFTKMVLESYTLLAETALFNHDKVEAIAYLKASKVLWGKTMSLPLLSKLIALQKHLNSSQTNFLAELEPFVLERFKEPYLSEEALSLFLLISRQTKLNLTAARQAANLSPRQLTSCLEELLELGLIDKHYHVLAKELADLYLEQQPSLQLELLLALRDHTEVSESYTLYQQIYRLSQSFGGIGYWSSATKAYLAHIQNLLAEERFLEVIELCEDFRRAELQHQCQADADICFFYAIALYRLSRYSEATELLRQVPSSAKTKILHANLAWRAGKPDLGENLAKEALTTANQDVWVLALGYSLLGNISRDAGRFQEAEDWFLRAEVQVDLAGQPLWMFSIKLNRGRILARLNHFDAAYQTLLDVAEKGCDFKTLQVIAYQSLGELFALKTHYADYTEAEPHFLKAKNLAEAYDFAHTHPGTYGRALMDWAYAAWSVKRLEPERAIAFSEQALDLNKRAGDRLAQAFAHANIAIMAEDISKFKVALEQMQAMQQQDSLLAFLPDFERLLLKLKTRASERSDLKKLELLRKHDVFLAEMKRLEKEPSPVVLENSEAATPASLN